MSFQRSRQPSNSAAVTAKAGTIDRTPPTSEPKNGAPSTTIAAPSSAIANHAPRRPIRCVSRPVRITAPAASCAYPRLPSPE